MPTKRKFCFFIDTVRLKSRREKTKQRDEQKHKGNFEGGKKSINPFSTKKIICTLFYDVQPKSMDLSIDSIHREPSKFTLNSQF